MRQPAWVRLTTAAALAVALPSLLAWNAPPSTTFLNQALAVGLWGVFAALAGVEVPLRAAARAVSPALLALALLGAASAASSLVGGLPASLALAACAMLAAAAVVLLAGSLATPSARTAVWVGLALAALPNVGVAFVQVFAPQWADGDVIARSSLAGRAVGNLRQPNHLSTLLLCGVIGLVALVELGRLRRALAAVALAESVESSSRLAIWRDTLVLIREHPWWGVGFGEFNFAWTLTPLPQRPVAFFDHTHDLPLRVSMKR